MPLLGEGEGEVGTNPFEIVQVGFGLTALLLRKAGGLSRQARCSALGKLPKAVDWAVGHRQGAGLQGSVSQGWRGASPGGESIDTKCRVPCFSSASEPFALAANASLGFLALSTALCCFCVRMHLSPHSHSILWLLRNPQGAGQGEMNYHDLVSLRRLNYPHYNIPGIQRAYSMGMSKFSREINQVERETEAETGRQAGERRF